MTEKWLNLLKLLPGYDAVATALPGMYFDEDEANNRIAFIEQLTHVEGTIAGKPFILQPWQKALIGCLFGWKMADGSRRYRELLLYIGRGNGKTPLAAAIALSEYFQSSERGKQIYCAAAEREQAALLFRHARGMVEGDEYLNSICTIFKSTGFRSIILNNDAASVFKVLSSDAATKHGQAPSLVIVDELHAHKDRELVDVLQSGMAKANRQNPLMVFITTADYDRPSICNEKHDYACKVRDRIIDDARFLPVIYETARDADWKSEAVWKAANPNWGVSVSPEGFAREMQKAQETPSYENEAKRLFLNMKTETSVRFLPMDKWDQCAGDPVTMTTFDGQACFVGVDLASTKDVAAVVLYFPQKRGVLPFFYVPEANADKRERNDKVPYRTWARSGLVTLTPGNVVDYDFIRNDLNRLRTHFNIREIAIDRWNSTQMQTQLMGDGFTVIQFGQGYASMTAPTKELEKLVVEGRLWHGGNPVLRWMASNVCAVMDSAGNIKCDKSKSSEKIDGIVALIMGLGRALIMPVESVYESKEMLIL